ncbi:MULTISPECIES: DUF4917 family protein [unclassified Pseudomonas]|uniref:DUF4917 family protein n=1 Tax=unclassified Pseudomonas TaxID=196821 RepID=UPI00035F2524|nr:MULTISPECIES: DUF4917 family protein [unclassified Pseudomonas]MCF5232347.1 DUF4917 family protein [Pseudomonas sp. PA-5-4H]MCF5236461.1 DUF4917 family protein [Pseudomonas sp. PA-5-4G]MCF5250846.1 DUF4917 family protein [Pseudomonas sp. PA-5-4B]MCF5256749.1 DUF4917 family protein [Pseudomonas sp. PA-5-4B]MCF5260427.1 DUF4917 family protein [Pseudomonas sp. PA-5-4A]
MITYNDAIISIPQGQKPSILLANGFSQAWDHTIFNYKYLLQAADFGDRSTPIKELFKRLNTYDFEKVMKRLVSTQLVLEIYDADPQLIAKVKQDQEVLKSALISAISNTHPPLPNNVTDEQYISARTFLSQFTQIFTLNYDLLLYWARNKNNLPPEYYSTNDGFGGYPLQWRGNGSGQQVHFLHGGLHLYDTVSGVKKHKCTEDGVPIIDQVRNNLENGKFPLFVAEPTYEKKRARIEHNPYLNYCFRKLRSLRDTLFIYGHSIADNDSHIFEEIKHSQVEKVFISIYGDAESKENQMTMMRAKNQLFGFDIEFFQAETTPIWAAVEAESPHIP